MNLIYVWYSDKHFIIDSLYFPYMSNLLYNSRYRRCYVFYYVDSSDSGNFRDIADDNIYYYDFGNVFPKYTMEMSSLKNIAQKIDFMKIVLLCHAFEVLREEDDLMLLDFDCHILSVKNKIYNFEPFYCKDVTSLEVLVDNEADSYIENYATRIDRLGSYRLLQIFIDIKDNYINGSNSNSLIYALYISMTVRYFKQYHDYDFSTVYKDMRLISSVDITYSRGSTWKNTNNGYNDNPYWVIKYKRPFNKEIKDKIYEFILFNKFLELYNILYEEINFPYNYNIFWLNNKQRNGTLKEMVYERIPSGEQSIYISLIDRIYKKQQLYAKYHL
ncbi:hypothetical protein [Turkeypox virus]|uniref:Uncharacterized protein n=1 Tax=Turkeypox virus TaxID=336486 RepID=A0A0M3ZRS2_9POXV|nr:hypothetical protein ASN15_gp160 [Turkeypox virus]ALA62534.1 hypothetical protein [Turkeypox virus]